MNSKVSMMRVLVVGAGKLGCAVIRQLRKNEGIEIVVSDPRESPEAVSHKVIEKVDLRVHVTAMNFEEVVCEVQPDLVLLARTVDDWEKEDTPMGSQYVLGMERELTKYGVAVIPVSAETFSHV